MLVLSRKPDQQIVIDGNIIVTIVRVTGGSVRIGIEAPAEVSIRRSELAKREAGGPDLHSGVIARSA